MEEVKKLERSVVAAQRLVAKDEYTLQNSRRMLSTLHAQLDAAVERASTAGRGQDEDEA